MVQAGEIMKNRYRYGTPLVGLLLVAIISTGCGASQPVHSAHKVSAVVTTTTTAPTTTLPVATTTTTAPPVPVTTTAPPRPVIIVEAPATTVPTTIPPPPPCQAGDDLREGSIGGTYAANVGRNLFVVGQVYLNNASGYFVDPSGGQPCTYVAPPAGPFPPCPNLDGLRNLSAPVGPPWPGTPALLWEDYQVDWVASDPSIPVGTTCTYVGP